MNSASSSRADHRQPPRFHLGEWLVDAASHELLGAAGRLRLQPRQMQLLQRLAREPGTVLRREQLLEEVWEGRYVNDEALSRAIAELRQLLGDDPRAPRYIETVPKLGYRLIAVPQAEEVPPPAATAATTPADRPLSTALDTSDLPRPDPHPQRRSFVSRLIVGIAVVTLIAVIALTLPRGAQQHAAELRGRVDRARPFSTEPGFSQSARFSRDGHWVAWSVSDARNDAAHIWIASRDGQSRRVLSEGADWDLSPVFVDGDTAVVFARYQATRCELREQKLIDRQSRHIGNCAPPPATSRIDASPADGRRIVFAQALDNGRTGLASLDRRSGVVTALTDPGEQALADHDPRFSGDGSQMIFTRGRNSHQRLWLLPLAEPARARVLVDSGGLLYGAAWLPGDTGVILAGDLFGYRALYRADAASGAPEFLGARGARYPDVAADGGLLFEIADYQANIWRADLHDPSAPPHAITQSQRYNNQPAFSPDGRHLAFGSNRDGLESVYLANSDGSDVERLALDPAQRWVRPSWHPDGSQLLVTAILNRSIGTECLPYACGSEHSALYRYDLAARHATLMAGLGDDVRYGQYGTDGRHLYFLRPSNERNQLWRAAADGSAPRLLLDVNVDNFTLDRQYLIVDIADESGLRVCNLDGDHCRVILDQPLAAGGVAPENTYAALHEGRLVFAARGADGKRRLYRYDLDNDTSDLLLDDAPSTFAPALAFSPDGRWLAYSRNDRIAIDLYLGEARSLSNGAATR